MKNRLIFTLFFLVYNLVFAADLRFPVVFADNMVLQQSSNVAIWGRYVAGQKLKIVGSWNQFDTVVALVDNLAKFKTILKTPKAGGPYTLKVIGKTESREFHNVMMGEVWLCSGQSNMGFVVGECNQTQQDVANADTPNIRSISISRTGSETLQENANGDWQVSNSNTVKNTSAVGYFFARELQKKLNVPVGIICSSWGGTPVEVWMKQESFDNDSVLKNVALKLPSYTDYPNKIAACYNGMIHPIIPYGIAGVIWYQGESNTKTSQTVYAHSLETMIDSWRKDFGKDFPFYFVQIAPFQYKTEKAYIIREQQALVAKYPGCSMVVVSDLVDDVKNIHPNNKIDVGNRLANLALNQIYNDKSLICQSPIYKSMKVKGSQIIVEFANAPNGLICKGEKPTCFYIAGVDQKFVVADAVIQSGKVIVSNTSIKSPVAVRFSFTNDDIPNLFSLEGLPAAPFRTDNWAL